VGECQFEAADRHVKASQDAEIEQLLKYRSMVFEVEVWREL
jgi:hypothetical protein